MARFTKSTILHINQTFTRVVSTVVFLPFFQFSICNTPDTVTTTLALLEQLLWALGSFYDCNKCSQWINSLFWIQIGLGNFTCACSLLLYVIHPLPPSHHLHLLLPPVINNNFQVMDGINTLYQYNNCITMHDSTGGTLPIGHYGHISQCVKRYFFINWVTNVFLPGLYLVEYNVCILRVFMWRVLYSVFVCHMCGR